MLDNPVSIRITVRYEHPRVFGIPLPLTKIEISNGSYSSSDGHSFGNEMQDDPLECIVNLLIQAELNKKDEQLIGPIHATFELPGKSRQCGLLMEKILNIYARSENTTITFDYKE